MVSLSDKKFFSGNNLFASSADPKDEIISEADIENVVNVYFTNDTLNNTLNGETTEAQRTVLAKALQAYINLHKLAICEKI